jgi:hypothetical protein
VLGGAWRLKQASQLANGTDHEAECGASPPRCRIANSQRPPNRSWDSCILRV